MRIKYILVLLFIFSNAYAYECKVKEFPFKMKASKKNAYQVFAQTPRQILVEGLLFHLTDAEAQKHSHAKNTIWVLDYLENTEQNADQRAFFQLLKTTSNIELVTPKVLNLNEVCDIMVKVNKIESK